RRDHQRAGELLDAGPDRRHIAGQRAPRIGGADGPRHRRSGPRSGRRDLRWWQFRRSRVQSPLSFIGAPAGGGAMCSCVPWGRPLFLNRLEGWSRRALPLLAMTLLVAGCSLLRGPPPETFDLAAPASVPARGSTSAQL